MIEFILTFAYVFFTGILVLAIPFLRKTFFQKDTSISTNEDKRERIVFFDFLRGLAILAVVIIHIGDVFLLVEGANLFLIKTINNISRFAVPFFFIISGILLTREGGWLSFYRKKIIRIFLPFFIISSLIGLYNNSDLLSILHSFISGTASLPYYFMSVLLQFYILYPVLEKYSKKKHFLLITFLISFISFFLVNIWVVYKIPLFLRYLFFFAFGISQKDRFLSKNYYLNNKQKLTFSILILWFLFYASYFQVYFYNTLYFYAPALFVLFFLLKDNVNKKPLKLFSYLGRNSLWIYLIHYLLIQFLAPYVLALSSNFYLQYFYFIVVVLPVSVLVSLFVGYTYKFLFRFLNLKY